MTPTIGRIVYYRERTRPEEIVPAIVSAVVDADAGRLKLTVFSPAETYLCEADEIGGPADLRGGRWHWPPSPCATPGNPPTGRERR